MVSEGLNFQIVLDMFQLIGLMPNTTDNNNNNNNNKIYLMSHIK